MPEMLMRYKNTVGSNPMIARQRALKMVTFAQDLAESLFANEVVWECRPFDDTHGMPDFCINVWVTDNEDLLVDTISVVEEKVEELMAVYAYDEEFVECWAQRVKGKWGRRKGKMRRR